MGGGDLDRWLSHELLWADNLSTFTLLKQIAQIPPNLLLARVLGFLNVSVRTHRSEIFSFTHRINFCDILSVVQGISCRPDIALATRSDHERGSFGVQMFYIYKFTISEAHGTSCLQTQDDLSEMRDAAPKDDLSEKSTAQPAGNLTTSLANPSGCERPAETGGRDVILITSMKLLQRELISGI